MHLGSKYPTGYLKVLGAGQHVLRLRDKPLSYPQLLSAEYKFLDIVRPPLNIQTVCKVRRFVVSLYDI